MEENTQNLSSIIARSRIFLMGLAMIVIMLFHNSFGVLGYFSLPFSVYGHWGVDVFIFLSGFGIYHALKKNGLKELRIFYSRRLLRIMPASIIAGACMYFLGRANLLALLGLNMWYIRTILILYFLSPILYVLLTRFSPTRALFAVVILSVIGVLLGVPLLDGLGFTWQTTITWTFARLSSFIVGMYVAHVNIDLYRLKRTVPILVCWALLIVLLLLHLERYRCASISTYLHLLPYIVLAVLLPFFCCLIYKVYSCSYSVVRRCVEFFGMYSLEIYLVHEAIFREIIALHIPSSMKFLTGYGISIILAVLLHFLAAIFCRLFIKIKTSAVF